MASFIETSFTLCLRPWPFLFNLSHLSCQEVLFKNEFYENCVSVKFRKVDRI